MAKQKTRFLSARLLHTTITALAIVLAVSVFVIWQSATSHAHRMGLLGLVATELGLLEMIAVILRRFLSRQRKAENLLRENEEFARSVVDALPMHIAIIDGTGVVLSTNGAWRDFANSEGEGTDRIGEGANYLAFCEQTGGAQKDPRS
ncbi:MAG TPA: hypothetical protein VLJ39_19295, partial [Tepidisphaeraceae bacterium]|nr:hypothetical protein [Tepidisphaeraceae bacterium]